MANKNDLSPKGKSRRNQEIQRDDDMKKHYDFSVAERGKFYRADAEFQFPVYLEPDVNEFMTKLAEQKKVAVDELVNELLRAYINIIQSAGS
jgi:predicted HicB family RNase H-like nuclease